MGRVVNKSVEQQQAKREFESVLDTELKDVHKSLTTIETNVKISQIDSIAKPLNMVMPICVTEDTKLMGKNISLNIILGVNRDIARINPDYDPASGSNILTPMYRIANL